MAAFMEFVQEFETNISMQKVCSVGHKSNVCESSPVTD